MANRLKAQAESKLDQSPITEKALKHAGGQTTPHKGRVTKLVGWQARIYGQRQQTRMPQLSTTHCDQLSSSTGTTANFHVGDRVLVHGDKPGVISFLGTTHFAKGIWAGIILDTFVGKNNGSVAGVQYFECEPNRGLFLKPEKLKLESEPQSPANKNLEQFRKNFKVGDQILVDNVKSGEIRFIGKTQFARGDWVGINLDTPDGKNDGSVRGVQYFDCAPNHGLFIRPNLRRLTLVEAIPPPIQHQPPAGANIPPAQVRISRGSSLEGSSRASSSQPTDAARLQALRDDLKIDDHILRNQDNIVMKCTEVESETRSYLTISSLQSIQSTIFGARSKWYSIGIELNIDPNDLDAVKEKHQSDPDKCFIEVLTIWLRGNYSKRVWTTIVNALKAKAVGFGELAERVEKLCDTCDDDKKNKVDLNEENACGGDSIDDMFHCPCQGCSLDAYLSSGCPRSRLNSYPYLELSKFDKDNRKDLIQKLSCQTNEMIENFATLINETCESLQANGITTKSLIRCALSLAAYKSQMIQNPLLEEHERNLRSANTIDDVFIILIPHMSFFNYELLGYIIKRCGSEDNKILLDTYLQKFNEFCRRRVFEVSPDAIGYIGTNKPKRKKFAVLLTQYENKCTLMDIKEAQCKLATLLELDASSLHLHNVDNGSLILIFSVAVFLAIEIFPLNSLQIDCLKTEGYRIFVSIEDCDIKLPDDQDIRQEDFDNVQDDTAIQSAGYNQPETDMDLFDRKADVDPVKVDEYCPMLSKDVNDFNQAQLCHSYEQQCLDSSESVSGASYLQDLISIEQTAGVGKETIKDDIASGQFQCLICQNILQNPQCVSCCSSRFCKKCIEAVQLREEPTCPSCGSIFDIIGGDSALEQKLHTVHICCIHASLGCDWKGELAELNNHISNDTSPVDVRTSQGCQYVEVTCKQCSVSIRRSNMYFHRMHKCSKRQFTCEYCNEYTSSYEEVTNNHLPLCGLFPVDCSNGCGESLRRCDVESHISENCPRTIINCALREEKGCNVQLPRIDMRGHLLTHVTLHKLQIAISKANEYHEQVVQKRAQSKTLQVCGFKFAEAIPESFPLICPVCFDFLQDPYQAICCGKNFCKKCTKQIESGNKSCPLCKQSFETFFNKGHKQQLVQLKVFCKHSNSGCCWKGELGDLEKHLNFDPVENKLLEGCQFTKIHCVYCSKLYERSKIVRHWQVCGNYPVQCPNNCGKTLQRQCIKYHIIEQCELQVIPFQCDFQDGVYGVYRVSGLSFQSAHNFAVIECSECKHHLNNLQIQQYGQDFHSSTWVRLNAPRRYVSIKVDNLTGCYHFDQVLCTFCKQSINHDDIGYHKRSACPDRPQMEQELQYEDIKG